MIMFGRSAFLFFFEFLADLHDTARFRRCTIRKDYFQFWTDVVVPDRAVGFLHWICTVLLDERESKNRTGRSELVNTMCMLSF